MTTTQISIPSKWEHQVEAIRSVDGSDAHCILSPTGTGKSRVIMEIASREIALGRTPILTTGSRPMVAQLHREGIAFLGANYVHNAYRRKNYSRGKLNIESYIRLYNQYDEIGIDPDEITILIDEVHHAAYNIERNVPSTRLARVLLKHRENGGRLIGFTATLWRLSREEGFRPIFDTMWEAGPIAEFIEKDILADYTEYLPARGRRWREHVMMGQVMSKDVIDTFGDYKVVDTQDAPYPVSPELVVIEVQQSIAEMSLGRVPQTLVYVPRVPMALRTAELLREQGHRVALLCSDANLAREARRHGIPTDIEEVTKSFISQDINTIVNVGVVAEGVNFPAVECVIIGIATKSMVRWYQIVGRGLRKNGDKVCRLVDMTGNSIELGWPKEGLIEQSLDQRGQKGKQEEALKTCETCGGRWGTAKQICDDCGHEFGRTCNNCGIWHPWEFFELDWMNSRLVMGSGWCDPCTRGEDAYRNAQREMRERGLYPRFRHVTCDELFSSLDVRDGIKWLIESQDNPELLLAPLSGARPLPLGYPCMAMAPEANRTYSGVVIARGKSDVAILVADAQLSAELGEMLR